MGARQGMGGSLCKCSSRFDSRACMSPCRVPKRLGSGCQPIWYREACIECITSRRTLEASSKNGGGFEPKCVRERSTRRNWGITWSVYSYNVEAVDGNIVTFNGAL